MRSILFFAALSCALLAGAQVSAQNVTSPASLELQTAVRQLLSAWNTSLLTGKPASVADMYVDDYANLLPTVSNNIRTSRAEILDYFNMFLLNKPYAVLRPADTYVRVDKGDNKQIAVHDGVYDVFLTGKDGKVSSVGARFTFVYKKLESGSWKIITHHSSKLPEPEPAVKPPSEVAVAGRKMLQASTPRKAEEALKLANEMFARWNATLQTGNASAVAKLYKEDGVLLPTVSNNVRTDGQEIEAYFKDFLQRQPGGKIIESYVLDEGSVLVFNGIYDFSLLDKATNTRSTVPARFTYVYEKDGDTYKILTHHSSVLPESATLAFYAWNDALQTKDPAKVASMYVSDDGKNGILLPTVSNKIRSTKAQIEDYFTSFLKNNPFGRINQEFIDDNGAIQLHSGIYTFNFTTDGKTTQVPARFCYVYKKQAGGSWKILTHHSSAMPEKPTRRRSALENSVDFKTLDLEAPQGRRALLSQAEAEATAKKMFDDWIAALQTGSPTTVASKYASKGAVLLPTVSNVPRTNASLLEDYFTMFLKRKPVAVINEQYVVDETANGIIVHNGIYTFNLTDPATGKVDKVPARFTYVYKKQDDGQYKIQLHHSSAMPEPMTASSTPAANTTARSSASGSKLSLLATGTVAVVAGMLML